jgi:protein-tyrosine kinase
MSLIEQAAKRLEMLRQSGAQIPDEMPDALPARPAPERPAVSAPVFPAMAGRDGAAAVNVAATPVPAASTPDALASIRVQPVPLQAPPVAVQSKRVDIDLQAIAERGVIIPDAPRSQIAEEYRVIKRPLISNAMGRGAAPATDGNLIMVTSALPREGKSFTSVNLAMSIAAELDNTVMLVDADVARPSVLNILGLPPSPGLLDLLTDESTKLSDVLMRTNVEKLTLLPSGSPHKRATELLASDAMAKLLREMADRYPIHRRCC